MAVWDFAVVTNDGLNLQAKQTAGTTMTFTKVKTSGASVPAVLLQSQTEVADPKQEFIFSANPSYLKDGGGVELKFIVTNEGVTARYDCYQVGIYANDPNKGEILYAILQTINPMTVPAYDSDKGWSSEFNVGLQYGNASQVDVYIDAAGTISQQTADGRYMQKVKYQDVSHELVRNETGVWLKEEGAAETNEETAVKLLTSDDFLTSDEESYLLSLLNGGGVVFATYALDADGNQLLDADGYKLLVREV